MSKDLLKKALEEAMDEDMSFIPKRQELEQMHEFSKKFDKKVRKMAVKNKSKSFRYQKTLRVMAACLAVVILAGVFRQTTLFQNKSMDSVKNESISTEWDDNGTGSGDMTTPMEDESTDEAEQESTGESYADKDVMEQEESLPIVTEQIVEEAFVGERLQQLKEVECRAYQLDGSTCNIWLEQKVIKENDVRFDAKECIIYLCTNNGEWYQYTLPYEVQRDGNGEQKLHIANFPEKEYERLYVEVDNIVITIEKK